MHCVPTLVLSVYFKTIIKTLIILCALNIEPWDNGVMLVFAVASVQAGQVMAYPQPSDRYHREDHGGPREPVLCLGNHHFHLCCHGHAAVRQQLHGRKFRRPNSALALQRLLALVHDSVPGAVWRMDRIHVGLYALWYTASVYSVLPLDNGDRQFGGESSFAPGKKKREKYTTLDMLSRPFFHG